MSHRAWHSFYGSQRLMRPHALTYWHSRPPSLFALSPRPMPQTPLRIISTDDVQGRLVLLCAQHSVAVHSIHSACDNACGGISEWLVSSLAPGNIAPILPHAAMPEAGKGRLLECREAVPLSTLVARLKALLQARRSESQAMQVARAEPPAPPPPTRCTWRMSAHRLACLVYSCLVLSTV